MGKRKLMLFTRSDRVHGSWLEIYKDGSGDIFATCGLVVVDIDPLQLKIRVSVVGSSGVNTMLIRDDLQKFRVNKKSEKTSEEKPWQNLV